MVKPLGQKAYGSIPHLPNSRLGPADRSIHEGQARICTEKARDAHDEIIVQEKLDGSCCAVAKVRGRIFALGRAGYPAESSKYALHHVFAEWVYQYEPAFLKALSDGQRIVGEWLAQAHGTRYDLSGRAPFVPFDLMEGAKRAPVDEVEEAVSRVNATVCQLGKPLLLTPWILHRGGPISVEELVVDTRLVGHHGAIDPLEGFVYRVERKGAVDFLAKWVQSEKVDGCYLPEISGAPAVWNWRTRR